MQALPKLHATKESQVYISQRDWKPAAHFLHFHFQPSMPSFLGQHALQAYPQEPVRKWMLCREGIHHLCSPTKEICVPIFASPADPFPLQIAREATKTLKFVLVLRCWCCPKHISPVLLTTALQGGPVFTYCRVEGWGSDVGSSSSFLAAESRETNQGVVWSQFNPCSRYAAPAWTKLNCRSSRSLTLPAQAVPDPTLQNTAKVPKSTFPMTGK